MKTVLNSGTSLFAAVDGEKKKVGLLRAISEMKMDSDMVDVTTLDAMNGFRTYMQGLKSAGDITVDGFLSKDEESQVLLRSLFLSGQAAEWEIAYPDGEKCLFSALVKSVSMGGGEVDQAARFACVLKISGGVTFA
ncbi:MAG: hypothetical protein IKT57_05910 [Clostridia bacterium]|nr:hypothetical protein [Clostridia bacterium]